MDQGETLDDESTLSPPNARSASDISDSDTTMDFSASSVETDSQPPRYKPLSEIYNVTEPIELTEEELMLMGTDEPINYSQAAKEGEWRRVMKLEIDAVEKNGTWELTKLPPGRKPIDLNWIYKIKRDVSGQIIKYKARIVAKGYV